ncbi:MAG TPA: sigma-70 family RNA polymerase sigma factor [Verrucomicrobiae bacterium]
MKTSASFRTTQWNLVLTAAQKRNNSSAEDALARLCSIYWFPLYAFCRRQGRKPHDAEDLTQAFFAHLLHKNGLSSVRRENGRFRNFLLASIKNFLNNEWDRIQAQRRGGGCRVISINEEDMERQYSSDATVPLPPDQLFERKWAWAVLNQTMKVLRDEYVSQNNGILFDHLQGFLPGGRGTVSRAELAAERGVTVGAIDVAIHRMRHRFGAILRELVSDTVSSDADVDEEIGYLISVLGS